MPRPEQFEEMLNTSNFNFNRLCALDIITAGSEILEICIRPMNFKFQLAKKVLPFYSMIKPVKNPYYIREKSEYKNLGTTESYYTKAFIEGLPRTRAFEIFEKWAEKKIELLEGRKIMPLTYDWANKKKFLIDWMGINNFNHYFHFHVRDILSLTLFANDFTNFNLERPPYPKVDFDYICSQTRSEHSKKDAMINCHSIARIYNLMLHSFYGHVPAWTKVRANLEEREEKNEEES